jgi:hypothetical protein
MYHLFLCPPINCDGSPEEIAPSYFDYCNPEFRGCCFKAMHAALCSYAPTDVMSPTVIGADSASGKIRRLPFTKILPETPTQEIETDFDGCFNDRVTKTSRIFNLESKAFKANHSDDDYWLKFCNQANNSRITFIPQDEDGFYYVRKEWLTFIKAGATGTPPSTPLGLDASLLIAPYIDRGDGKGKCKWVTQIKIDYDCVLVGVLIPSFSTIV